MMHCTCERARREARAEAFREAAEIARRPFQPFSLGGALMMDRESCEAIADAILRHDDTPAAQRESAGSPARYFEVAEAAPGAQPVSDWPSGPCRQQGIWATRNAIVDCVEDDGFITAYVTDTDPSWPGEDGGLDG